jgi:hypothetical protein
MSILPCTDTECPECYDADGTPYSAYAECCLDGCVDCEPEDPCEWNCAGHYDQPLAQVCDVGFEPCAYPAPCDCFLCEDEEAGAYRAMPAGEERITSETGGQKGKKLARFDLIPVGPLWRVAELYGLGARKYEDRNWEKGYDWSLSYAAMQRHANLFWGGESIDPETKGHHLASVIFHAMALMEYEAKGTGTDDRP